MRVYAIRLNSEMLSVYECEPGQGIPWHRHPYAHGHVVLQGKTLVEIEGEAPVEMVPQMKNMSMPENVWHKATALEEGTIFIHSQPVSQQIISEIKDAA
jgi:quercetin dioxygenase-like cupin family protein